MKITVLGTGTSQGVPVIACDCHVCQSNDPKDARLRTSIMITINGVNYVVDSGPDFRQQMLSNNVKSLQGVLFTHEHKDHVAGLDDIRAFNFKERRDMDIYCSTRVESALRNEFHYIFSEKKYPGVPSVTIHSIDNEPFLLDEKIEVLPIEVLHYKLPVLGFRIGDFSYITDAKTIEETEKQKLKGSKVLIVNALRREEHISHFTLNEALDLIHEIKPEVAYLTHISHQFGRHEEIESELPSNVFVAFDGQVIEI